MRWYNKLLESIAGFFAWLRLAVIVLCPLAVGFYAWGWIGSDVAMYVWGVNDGFNFTDMMMQFLIASPFWFIGFYGVKYLLRLLHIDNRPNSD